MAWPSAGVIAAGLQDGDSPAIAHIRLDVRADGSSLIPSLEPEDRRPLVVAGLVRSDGPETAGAEGFRFFQGPGDPTMDEPALGRAHLGIRRSAQLVVAEIVAFGPLLAHDPATPQLVHGRHERGLVQTAGLLQNIQGELAADHCCDSRQAAAGRRKLRQALLDHGLNLRRRT